MLVCLATACQNDDPAPAGPSGSDSEPADDSVAMPGRSPESLPGGLQALDSQECLLVQERDPLNNVVLQRIRYRAQSGIPRGISFSDGSRDTFILKDNQLRIERIQANQLLAASSIYQLDPESFRVVRLQERDSTGRLVLETSYRYTEGGFLEAQTTFFFGYDAQGQRDTLARERETRDLAFGRMESAERRIIFKTTDQDTDTTFTRLTYDYVQGDYQLRNFQAAALRTLLGLNGKPARLRVRAIWEERRDAEQENYALERLTRYQYGLDSSQGLINSVLIEQLEVDSLGKLQQTALQESRFDYRCR